MSSTLPTDYWARVVYLVTHYSASFLSGAGSTLLIALVGTFVGRADHSGVQTGFYH